MITSITRKRHPFVLEADRTNAVEEQTVFHIVPKTVRGATETAANYAGVMSEKKRTGKKEIDVKAMQLADDKEWVKAVQQIDNYCVLPGAPGPTDETSGYDHFLSKSESEPAKYVLDSADGRIIIKSTEDETDLKYIMWGMSPADQEEIMTAYFSYSELKAGLKNA